MEFYEVFPEFLICAQRSEYLCIVYLASYRKIYIIDMIYVFNIVLSLLPLVGGAGLLHKHKTKTYI